MPLKQITPRRTSHHRRSAPATPRESDVKPGSLCDSQSIQDRIRQWQVQGAADASAPDAVSVRSNPASEIGSDRGREKVERPITPDQEYRDAGGSGSKRRTSRWADPESREWVRHTRSRSTPRKRVVSDEHWRAKPSPKESRTQPTAMKESVRLESPRDTPSPGIPQTREEREERRRKRREARRLRAAAAAAENVDDGIRVYATPPISRKPSLGDDARPARSDLYQPDDDRTAFSGRDSPPRFHENDHLDDSIRPDEDDGRHRRRSKYVATLERSPTSMQGPGSEAVRSRKGGLFSKTKEIFSKSESVPIVSNRVPSIEAWLEEQPDPFVDVGDPTADVPIPAPLKIKSHRRKVSVEPTISEDPNKIWDSVEPNEAKRSDAESERRRRSRRSKTPGLADEASSEKKRPADDLVSPVSMNVGNETGTSAGQLKRRGAKTSRNRQTSVAQETGPEHKPSATIPTSPSEIVDAYKYTREPAPPPYRACPPTGRHALSTIASVETFSLKNEETDVNPSLEAEARGLRRKHTTHEDLMSVLSQPRAGKSLKSARSVRRARDKVDKVSQQEILDDLVADEAKYSRELRTLVDGVIPVLLQSVLSKSDSAATAGLFASSASASDDLNFTKPIIDMGVALERLKSTHNRIPTQELEHLLIWAQTAQKTYKDYLTAWRLGFQDVVVNLAPLDESRAKLDQGMARDEDGDVLDSEGKKADVAYLLKRPLVRVKDLSKTFNRIKSIMTNTRAEQVAEDYVELTNLARRRNQEEQGRQEDELAAHIDATKARDPRTMAAVSGTVVDKSRRVKARDCFNMTLYHSSGQRIDCKIEMVLRENQPGLVSGGDVLICEVEERGKWLFFPPVEMKSISARKGDHPGHLVVMIRGRAGYGKDWQELLSLKADDDEAASDWMKMLGSNPLPPKLNRSPSFIDRESEAANPSQVDEEKDAASKTDFMKPLSVPDIDVPIGEASVIGRSEGRRRRHERPIPPYEKTLPKLNLGGGLRQNPADQFPHARPHDIQRKPHPTGSTVSSGRSTFSAESMKTSSFTSSIPRHEPSSGLNRTPANRRHAGTVEDPSSPLSGTSPVTSEISNPGSGLRKLSRTDNASREWMSSPEILRSSKKDAPSKQHSDSRPKVERTASTPSQDLPTISKSRYAPQNTPETRPLNQSIREQWEALSGSGQKSQGNSRPHRSRNHAHLPFTEDIPPPPPHSQRPRDVTPRVGVNRSENSTQSPPVPPPHKDFRASQPSNGNMQPHSGVVPALKLKSDEASPSEKQRKRRSSSPLKHEYAPSTASDSSSDSDSDDSSDASSDTSDDLGEGEDMATPLIAITARGMRRPSKSGQYGAVPTTGTRTLAPSDSASQGPYRSVPSASAIPAVQKAKTIALLCAWSDTGGWDPVHPDDCSIVVSPGLIEAFEMSAAHSGSIEDAAKSGVIGESRTSSLTQQPLVAFELTPLVPLRRGTALDISIRSPATANSRIKTTNNVMFRSRSPGECEALYNMINWARINNPTYIALERARPKRQPTVTFNTGQAQQSRSKSGSWFGFGSQKRSSYRASSAPTPSVDASEASVSSMSSAFSALKRFGQNSGFNLSRSSAMRKEGLSPANSSLYSSSSGSGTNTPAPSQAGFIPGKDGPNVPSTSADAANGGGMINNMKIRLYIREDMSRWVNLGAARLTVLPPPPAVKYDPNTPNAPFSNASPPDSGGQYHARPSPNGGQPEPVRGGPRLPSSSYTPHRIHGDGREKRILVTANKDAEQVFIDRVLGESCFERIMQSGIAVKIWEEDERIADRGGVVGGRAKTYMLQFPGAREAGWVFGICGTYRYQS